VVLTSIFWALFCLPGYAFVRRLWAPPRDAGVLYTLAFSCVASLLMLSPISLLCYLLSAPLYVFSAACAALSVIALGWLARSGAQRELWAQLRAEPPLAWLLLACLLWLQARSGGWLEGDAQFHLARMRVLLEHGFTNRDIYLADDHFQAIYHSNLLYPLYASLAQLTRQSYLQSWFYTEAWAKLLVAAGHYVFAYALTRQRFAAYLFALCAITANAGETYALYPNTLCVGFLLPMLLGIGFAFAARENLGLRAVSQLAALDFLLAQIHALYAVYAALLLAPVLIMALLLQRTWRMRALLALALASLAAAAPFVWVSAYATRTESALETAPDDDDASHATPEPAPAPPAGIALTDPHLVESDALAAGGGHLEKVMDAIDDEHVVFNPRRMGGWGFVGAGFLALLGALLVRRGQRLGFVIVLVVALLTAAVLFSVTGASAALRLLRAPFVVARLSTVLTMLLFFGITASLAALPSALGRFRAWGEALVMLGVVALASQLLGHAPVRFADHVRAALEPFALRHAQLEQLEVRRQLLAERVPSGAIVLTTPRFARQLVMLRDCYVLAADRGHTGLRGISKRRRDLVVMNAANTAWPTRARLISGYDLHLVTFEHRWARRYRWAFEHGRLRGSAAGLDVIELDPVARALPSPAPTSAP
jgi:hypothetical protein